MNNINTTITSAFLSELGKDRSKIKTISPTVIFRRVLGYGENVDRAGVIKALQRHALGCNTLDKFRHDLIDKSFIGEVICFDVGPYPSWMKFSVVRESLPKPKKGSAINFIVTVTDRMIGKKWTRLIGAIANEPNDKGEMVPVLRTISDMCDEEDIPTAVNKDNLVPIDKTMPKDTRSDDSDIVIPNGKTVVFMNLEGVPSIIDNESGETLWSPLDGLGGLADHTFMRATNDIWKVLLRTCSISDIIAEFDKVDPGDIVIVKSGETVYVTSKSDDTGSWIDVYRDEACETLIYGCVVKDIDGFVKGEFKSKTDINGKFFDAHPITESKPLDENGWLMKGFDLIKAENVVEVPDPEPANENNDAEQVQPSQEVTSSVEDSELSEDETQSESPVIADIDQPSSEEEIPPQPENADNKLLIEKGSCVEFEDDPEADYIAKVDIYKSTWNNLLTIEEKKTLFDRKEKPKSKDDTMQLYAKMGDHLDLGDGKDYIAKVDITLDDVKNRNGAIGDLIEEVVPPEEETKQEEPPKSDTRQGSTEEVKPIGEIPSTTSIYDEISAVDHCMFIFGTTTPNIMHLLNFIKNECNSKEYSGDEFKLTQTFPVELIVQYDKYTYSIIRMKNGAYYRVWVCHTDVARAGEISWIKSHNEEGRWMRVCDIQDRDVGGLFNRRRV